MSPISLIHGTVHDGSMTWAPPTYDHLHDDDSPLPTPPRGEPIETDEERRGLSAVPAAVWIALLGSTLLLTAAVAVVASNWSTIGQGARVAGLVVVTVGLLICAERLRALAPSSSSIIAHVATYLTASVGIATLSVFGVTWPGCLLAGGAVLIAATEVQSARWRRITMHLAQIAGWAMAATGAAALLGTTAGLVAMIAAVGLLAAGAQRRSASLSILAVLSPALTALADAGIGDGTLLRAGLVGERLGWSGPAVGLLAATVIGAIARHRGNNPLMLVAAASPIVGVVTGLAASDGSAVAWWSVPALALAAAELGLWFLPTDQFRSQIVELVDTMAASLAGIAWFAPAIASFELTNSDLTFPWAMPITLTAMALALSLLRWKHTDSVLADLGLASLAATAIGLAVAFDAPALVTAIVAVVATAGAAMGSRRLSPAAIHPTAFWAAVAVVVLADGNRSPSTAAAVMLLAAVVGIVVAARARLATGWLGRLEMGGVVAGAAIAAIAIFDGAEPAIGLAVAAIVACTIVLVERRFNVWGISTIAVAAVVTLDAATATGSLDPWYWAGLAVSSAALSVVWLVHRSPLVASAAASAAVFAIAAASSPADLPATDVIVMAMLAVTALTGLAFNFERRPALDAAAVSAGAVLLATTAFDVHPGWYSAAWLVLGMQIFVAGVSLDVRVVRWSGGLTAVAALISWWYTSGLHDWFVVVIEPADIRVADLWLAGASLAALVAGATLRSTLGANSWLAYGAALIVPGLWLTSVHIDRSTVWALPLLLTIGMVAAGLGAWHRLAAPLVGGTVLTAVGVFLATGSDLTAVPNWTWLALGGATLLGLAVLIERNGKPGAPDLKDLVSRWN